MYGANFTLANDELAETHRQKAKPAVAYAAARNEQRRLWGGIGGLAAVLLFLCVTVLRDVAQEELNGHIPGSGQTSVTVLQPSFTEDKGMTGRNAQLPGPTRGQQGTTLTVFEGTYLSGSRQGPCFPEASGSPTMGASLVCAASGRVTALGEALGSWLAMPTEEVAEVILVDWGAWPPLADQLSRLLGRGRALGLLGDPRVRLVRAEPAAAAASAAAASLAAAGPGGGGDGDGGGGPPPPPLPWNLPRAYNLALQFAAPGAWVLKVDADTLLERDFFARHPLPPPAGGGEEGGEERFFYRGNWRHAPDENGKHLNGIVFAPKQALWAVRGYDERMRGYGHDDADLYLRLASSGPPGGGGGGGGGLRERPLDYGALRHLAHGDQERASTFSAHGNLKWVDHSRNIRGANETFAAWHRAPGLRGSSYALSWDKSSSGGVCKAVPLYAPPGFMEMLSPSEAESFDLRAHHWALRIYSQKAIPWDKIQQISHLPSLRALMAIYRDMLDNTWKGSYLVVRARHGVAERLGAYCSARAFAARAGARLVTVWAPDDRSGARYSDLLTPEQDELVIEEWDPSFFDFKKIKKKKWGWRFKKIDYVSENFRDKPDIRDPLLYHHVKNTFDRLLRMGALIRLEPGKVTFVESAHMLATDPVVETKDVDQCYRSIKASRQVKLIMKNNKDYVGPTKVGAYLPLYPGHPRYIQEGHSEPTFEDKNVACNLKDFSAAVQKLWPRLNQSELFLSCETQGLCHHAQAALKVPVRWAHEERRGCDGPGVTAVGCEQVLLADAFLLSRSGLVLAPAAAAPLDLARRLAPHPSSSSSSPRRAGGGDGLAVTSPCGGSGGQQGRPLAPGAAPARRAARCGGSTLCRFVGDVLDELQSVF